MAARTATTVGSEHGAGPARWRGMTRQVAAQEHGAGEARPRWAVEPVETTVVAAGATQKLREELLAGPDLPAVLGAAELTEVREAEHRLADGRTLWLIVATVTEQVGILALRDDRGRSAAFLIDVGEPVRLTRFSENGQLVWVNHTEQVLQECAPYEVPCGCWCRFDRQRSSVAAMRASTAVFPLPGALLPACSSPAVQSACEHPARAGGVARAGASSRRAEEALRR